MLKRISVKVRVDPEKGIVAKLQELRNKGYKFEVIHSRGENLFDLKILFDAQTARPISEVSGIVIASSDI